MAVGSMPPPNFAEEKPKTGRESPDTQIFPEEVRVEPGLSFQPWPPQDSLPLRIPLLSWGGHLVVEYLSSTDEAPGSITSDTHTHTHPQQTNKPPLPL